jgi:plastocyanin
MRALLVAALLFTVAATPAPPTGRIEGVVVRLRERTRTPVAEAAVYLRGLPAVARPPRTHVIRQRDLRFVPSMMVVVKGDTIAFPNDDRGQEHNVFSPAPYFDLKRYRGGVSRQQVFDTLGESEIFCNIHESMHADVLVVEREPIAITDASGRFRLDELPPGDYQLVVWRPHSAETVVPVHVEAGKTVEVPVDIQLGAAPSRHRRKDGTPYPDYRR